MEIREARGMLSHQESDNQKKVTWADLGCGSGTFTLALAELLSAGSHIHAIDHDAHQLRRIPENHNGVRIFHHHKDFVNEDVGLAELDGILMANSLHYVKKKHTFLETIIRMLKPGGEFLIVEYNTTYSNPWIPYPIPFEQLKVTFNLLGFSLIQKLKERPSVYNPAPMYSATIRR